MSETPRTIIWGFGNYGQEVLRQLVAGGAPPLAVIDRRAERVGLDAGLVAGLSQPLNVSIRSPLDAVDDLPSLHANVCLLCAGSSLDDIFEPAASALKAGMNCLSLAEEALYPWTSSPNKSRQLDEIARQAGVTIAGGGANDVLMAGVPVLLSSAASRLKSLETTIQYNVHGDARLEAAHGVGSSLEDFERLLGQASGTDHYSRPVVECICSMLCFRIVDLRTAFEPIVSSSVGSPGQSKVSGKVTLSEARTAEGVTVGCRCIGVSRSDGGADYYKWSISGDSVIEAELKNPDHLAETAACLISRIEQVAAAPPGLATPDMWALNPRAAPARGLYAR